MCWCQWHTRWYRQHKNVCYSAELEDVKKYIILIVGTVFLEEHLDYLVALFEIVLKIYAVSSAVGNKLCYLATLRSKLTGHQRASP